MRKLSGIDKGIMRDGLQGKDEKNKDENIKENIGWTGDNSR